MKNFNYTIQIPEPCHEDWNNMQTDNLGRFCKACNKTVIDFSDKTDLEIQTLLQSKSNEKVCGHFRKSQLNRPLEIFIDLNALPNNMSKIRRFSIALFLVFGTLLFTCKDLNGQTRGEIEISTTKTENYKKGKIKMPANRKQEDSTRIKNPQVKPLQVEPMINGGIRYIETPVKEDTCKLTPIQNKPESEQTMVMGDIIQTMEDTVLNQKNRVSDTLIASTPFEFRVYPNPSQGELIINYQLLKRSDIVIEICDMNGKLIKKVSDIKQQHEGNYIVPVSINETLSGIYIIRCRKNGKECIEKLVHQK